MSTVWNITLSYIWFTRHIWDFFCFVLFCFLSFVHPCIHPCVYSSVLFDAILFRHFSVFFIQWFSFFSSFPFPPLGDLPDPGIKPVSPALASRFFTTEPHGKLHSNTYYRYDPENIIYCLRFISSFIKWEQWQLYYIILIEWI